MSAKAQRLTVAVIRLGSIGGVVAGCLAEAARHDVIACVRRPIERLILEGPRGTAELRLNAVTDPARAVRADWVLLCTKTYQTDLAAPWLSRLCTPSTRVAVLQNGIGHVARVAPLANGATVLPVIVDYNGERLDARSRAAASGLRPGYRGGGRRGRRAFAGCSKARRFGCC